MSGTFPMLTLSARLSFVDKIFHPSAQWAKSRDQLVIFAFQPLNIILYTIGKRKNFPNFPTVHCTVWQPGGPLCTVLYDHLVAHCALYCMTTWWPTVHCTVCPPGGPLFNANSDFPSVIMRCTHKLKIYVSTSILRSWLYYILPIWMRWGKFELSWDFYWNTSWSTIRTPKMQNADNFHGDWAWISIWDLGVRER